MKTMIIYLFSIILMLLGGKTEKLPQSALLQNETRIDSLIQQMTLEEKVDMLHGKHMFVSAGVERLGIADMIYADGPFGIREEMQPDSWMPLGLENDKATFFPTGSASGCYMESGVGLSIWGWNGPGSAPARKRYDPWPGH